MLVTWEEPESPNGQITVNIVYRQTIFLKHLYKIERFMQIEMQNTQYNTFNIVQSAGKLKKISKRPDLNYKDDKSIFTAVVHELLNDTAFSISFFFVDTCPSSIFFVFLQCIREIRVLLRPTAPCPSAVRILMHFIQQFSILCR